MPSPPDRVAISIMNIDIMWYGILITAALALAVFITYKRADKYGIKPEKVLDFSIICIPVGLIGARLYYVLFELDYYSRYPNEIINIRGGGLAIHGALILGFLTAVILCRVWKIKPLNALDLGAPSVVIAQAIGRWGNYFNQEAHGGPTDLPWGMMINGTTVHPTFLYESLWCILVFVALLFVAKNRKFQGQIFLLYCILYSFERFFVEHLRTDSLMLFDQYKQAQVLSIIVFIAGLALYVYLYRRGDKQDDNVLSETPGAVDEAIGAVDKEGALDASSGQETDDGASGREGDKDAAATAGEGDTTDSTAVSDSDSTDNTASESDTIDCASADDNDTTDSAAVGDSDTSDNMSADEGDTNDSAAADDSDASDNKSADDGNAANVTAVDNSDTIDSASTDDHDTTDSAAADDNDPTDNETAGVS